jgi:hypothetical protein
MRRRIVFCAALMAAAATPAAAQQCTLEYQRADNMWAAQGRPDGALGTETLMLQPGETKVFTTDWKYEKQRNDGTNYYGSHLRTARNTGKRPIRLAVRSSEIRSGAQIAAEDRGPRTLNPGATLSTKADLMEVSCPAADKKAAVPPPSGLSARQTSPTEIVLTWEKVPDAREYRVYVAPPPAAHMAGRPGVVGSSGNRYVITLPKNVAPSTVYRASIEAVGADGAASNRVDFNPVSVRLAASPAGGTGNAPSTPAPAGLAGKTCPPGQFITGFGGSGALICGRP